MLASSVTSTLTLEQLHLKVHLGCTEQERATPQEVRLSVTIGFQESPPGEKTDRLQDSICYAKVSEHIKQVVKNKHFALVEFLGRSLLDQLKVTYPHALFSLRVHKVYPPIDDLNGGVIYHLGDPIG